MKKETLTIAQQLGITKFPFSINNDNGKEIYFENSNGYWFKKEYDSYNNEIYYEDSHGNWRKHQYNNNYKFHYFENSEGYWYKKEFDSNGNQIYFENSDGIIKDNRPKVVELSIEEITDRLGIDSKLLKIVDK